jgi:hypothetical protein
MHLLKCSFSILVICGLRELSAAEPDSACLIAEAKTAKVRFSPSSACDAAQMEHQCLQN